MGSGQLPSAKLKLPTGKLLPSLKMELDRLIAAVVEDPQTYSNHAWSLSFFYALQLLYATTGVQAAPNIDGSS